MRRFKLAAAVLTSLTAAVAFGQGMQWSREFETIGPSSGGVYSMAPYDDGSGPTLVVGGLFGSIQPGPGWTSPRIARYDGTTWSPIGFGGFDDAVIALAQYNSPTGPRLFAGGIFQSPFNCLAMWDGSAWTAPWSPFVFSSTGAVITLCEFNGDLYVGGDFTYGIRRWDGTTMHLMGSGLDMDPGFGNFGMATSMCVYDDGSGPALYVGGVFLLADGVPVRGIARWNGSAWSSVGNGTHPANYIRSMVVHDDGTGAALYTSASMDGTHTDGLSKWDGQSWSATGGDAQYLESSKLCVFDDGGGAKIYAVGPSLRLSNGQYVQVARLEGTSWVAVGTGLANEVPTSMRVFDDGSGPRLCFGGLFSVVGGIGTRRMAAWLGSVGPISSVCPGDGAMRPCPCTPNGGTGRGCANSWHSNGAQLGSSGATATDDLALLASELPPSALVLFMQGDHYRADAPSFGDGLRCLSGTQIRVTLAGAQAGAAQVPEAGTATLRARLNAAGDALPPGAVRYYQALYRDVADLYCTAGSTMNATNGLRVVW